MKKVLAILFVLVLTFSMAVTVAADSNGQSVIEKGWVDENGDTLGEGDYPEIDLEFEILEVSATDNTYASYDNDDNIPDVVFSKTASSTDICVSGLDSIEGAGLFEYTIKEIDPEVAGVTATDDEYVVQILRTFVMDSNGKATTEVETASIAVYLASDTNTKLETINNTYVDGDLALDIAVTGNLADKDDDFTVEIVITSDVPVETDIVLPDGTVIEFEETDDGYVGKATVTISDNDGVKTITGIPEGVTVTVTEKNPDPYELVDYDTDGNETTTPPSIVMTSDGASVVITNYYNTAIDTGISLDSLPYILILVAVGGVAVFWMIRKRRNAVDAD